MKNQRSTYSKSQVETKQKNSPLLSFILYLREKRDFKSQDITFQDR